jgi:D-alanyl-D-alanine carboxypeptidase
MATTRQHGTTHWPVPARAGSRLIVAILAATLAVTVGQAPKPAAAGITPPCTIGDTLTRYRATADWYVSVLDTKFRLTAGYTPPDLVPASRSGASARGSIRRIALADLTAMVRASRAAGAGFAIESAYRSYAGQVFTFASWALKAGRVRALLASARPGHSEHQLGTAVDLKTPGGAAPWYSADWGTTRAGRWLAANSWRYGWVMSYQKARSPGATCYKYEPWHFRYVGRTIAAKIHASGLATREWLWLNGATSTWTGGGPTPTPVPTITPEPTATPEPSANPEPTASPEPTATPEPSDVAEPPASPSDAAASADPSQLPGPDSP